MGASATDGALAKRAKNDVSGKQPHGGVLGCANCCSFVDGWYCMGRTNGVVAAACASTCDRLVFES